MEFRIVEGVSYDGSPEPEFRCEPLFANVEFLFNGDLLDFPEVVIGTVRKVLEGLSESETFMGNMSLMEVGPETTRVYNLFDDENKNCELDTNFLYGLMQEWLLRVAEFRSKH